MVRPVLRRRLAAAATSCLLVFAGLASHGVFAQVETAPEARYIVVLKDPPLARYAGQVAGIPAPQTLPGRNRLDVTSPGATSYVQYLRGQQQAAETAIAQRLGRAPGVTLRMQHALNGFVTTLSAAEAEQVRRMPEVLLLDPVRDIPIDTDTGPTLVGAPFIWNGSATGVAAQGEGKVVGIIDTGINFGSPSFAAVDPIDAYTHVNPLGAGNYLGTCAPGGPDVGRCNAKLIGGYDFVCDAPVSACTNASFREEAGFGDTNGHGTHTASTVAGNRRDVTYAGANVRIQGMAPRANIIAYDVCYTILSTGQGSCPSSATAAAVNQAIADGIVDVLNFSISGGVDPWTDATSLAFLSATSAGIYVAASAGNSGPGANTMGHHEPWVASTAAAQHGRNGFAFTLQVTGPAPVPANVASIAVNQATGGVAFNATIPGSTPLRISSGIDGTSDGCAAYPANTFAGAIAVIRRGTCSFSIKANNAAAAGAVAMILANNAAGTIIPSVPGTTIPVFAVLQTEGDALRNFGQANPATATAQIAFPASVVPNLADQLGSFSSRGPAGTYDILKPDMTAPGVNILAAFAGTTLTGSEGLVELLSGTSMASPHNAGGAALLRQLRPTWTVQEIKSALMMSATRAVVKEDGTTAATPFDMGAGRIRVHLAADAALVMDETGANFTAANPATGGRPATLNVPGLGKRSCVGECQFVRTFRNPGATSRNFTATLAGLAGTVTPANFTVAAGATVSLTVTIDTSAVTPDGAYRFGWLEILPQNGSVDSQLNLPISISVPPPVIGISPATQAVSVPSGATTTATVTVSNNGSFPLAYAVENSGTGLLTNYSASNTGVNSGFRNTTYTDPATAGSQGQYAADDFVLVNSTQIRSISVVGFVVSGVALTTAATNLTWSIYPDASGLPAGNPQTNPAAAAWTFTSTPTGAGVTTVGSTDIKLDLVAAGQNVTLPPGRYWLLVNTRGTFANRFAQYGSNSSGNPGFASITIATNGTGSWVSNPSFPGLSMTVMGAVPCGAAWMGSSTPPSGSITEGGSQNVVTSLNAAALVPGDYQMNVCYSSNDTTNPRAASVVTLSVKSSQLAFTTPPSTDAVSGVPFAQQPVVTAQDATTVTTATTYALPITLAIASGTGTLTCNANPVTPVNGVATFSGCRITGTGPFTLKATSSLLADSTTNPAINVAQQVATQLAFTTQPGGGASGAPWSTQPAVTVRDAGGNTVSGSSAQVLLEITTPAGATLTCGANPLAATAGVATFAGCRIDKSGTYTLKASSGGLTSATSASFTVTPLQLTVAKAGAGSGIVTSSPAGIDCGSACSAGFDAGTTVTLLVTPAGSSTFGGWSGACIGGGACTVTMDAAKNVTATFNLTAGVLSPNPGATDFGPQSINTTSPATLVTFTNTGGQPVTVTSITAPTHFGATHDCTTVNPGASCTASVTFTPTAEGNLQGSLTVSTDSGGLGIPLTGVGERSLVTHFYRSILRRAPDAPGKAYWEAERARLVGLGANVNETWYLMATLFFASPEYGALGRDNAGLVTDLYRTFFNREPDAPGLAYWTGQLASGLPRLATVNAFLFSTEFKTFTEGIFGPGASRKEVDTVMDFYRAMLLRLPDSGGMSSWVALFRTAQCAPARNVGGVAQVMSDTFVHGGEYVVRNRNDAQFVADLYSAYLRRGGDLAGLQFWVSRLQAGDSRDFVRSQFFASAEFTARLVAIGAEACLPGG